MIAPHHERVAELVRLVAASVAFQRLVDEVGLACSPGSFRRYMRAHFDEVRARGVVLWRPGEEAYAESHIRPPMWRAGICGAEPRSRALSLVRALKPRDLVRMIASPLWAHASTFRSSREEERWQWRDRLPRGQQGWLSGCSRWATHGRQPPGTWNWSGG